MGPGEVNGQQLRLPSQATVELHVGQRTCWVYPPAGRTRAVLNRCPVRAWDPAKRCWTIPAQAAHPLAKSLRRARFEVDIIEIGR